MSTSLSLGLVIGATVAAGFQTAMLTVNKTVEKLKTTSEALNIRQEQLKQKIKSLPEGASGIVKLQREYDALGKSIQRVAQHQASLKKTIEAGAQLKQQRADLRTNITETTATGVAMLAPVYGGIKAAGNHEDNVKDISITGEFDAAQEQALSKTVRAVALQMNQTTDAVSAGLKTLVAGGIQSADELTRYAPVMAKTATATRAQMDDISDTFLALANNMKISAADSESAMNIMVKSTKLGQVEFKDMSKWMPQLTPMLADLGMTGKESVAQLASMLQIAKIGAGSADEAGNNLKNLITKINSPDTIKDFEKVGIDLKESLKQSAANGIDPVTAMLGTVEKYMSTALTGQDLVTYQKAMAEKDDSKAAEMFKSLAEAGNMGQLFQDMQAMSALRAMLQNRDDLRRFTDESLAAGNTDMLGDDFNKRTQGLTEQWKSFGIAIDELNIGLGALFLEPLKDITRFVKELALGVGNFVKNNPALSKTIGYIAGAVAVFSALSVVVLGVGAVMSGLAAIASMAAIGFSLVTLPIALIIAGVAALAYGAYQLYQNWEPIKAWFSDLWQSISDGVREKTTLMSMTIEGWVNGIKSWFTELKTWFSSLWQDLLSGLLNTVNLAKEAFNSLMPERFKIGVDLPKMPKLPELTAPKVQGFELPKLPSIKPLDVPEPSSFNSTRGTVIDQSTVHFTPNIVLPAGTPEQTVSSVKQALSISQTEFEQRYKQMQRNNQRLNFATGQ